MKISGTVHKQQSNKKAILKGVLAALFWIAVWQIVYIVVNREVLIASPLDVFIRIFELCGTKDFWLKTAHSLLSILEGYLLAIIVGVMLAVVTAASDLMYTVFKPFLNIIRATPVASFIILALVWMTKADVPVFISFLMVMPIVWANITTGIEQTDSNLLEMAHIYHFGRKKTLKNIYIPSVMPMFVNSVTTGLGFAWKSGIAAEVLSTPKNSIGTELYNSKVYLETVDLFAWTVVIILLSIILEKLFVFIINKCFKGKKG